MKLSKIIFLFFITAFIILSSSNNIKAQSLIQKEITEIENNLLPNIHAKGTKKQTFNLQERMEHHKVPGISIAIVKNGKLHWSKAYGLRNANTKTKVDTKTMFQIASVTKPITALGILKLVEQDKIALDNEVNTYLKGWQIQDNEFTKTEKVTIRRLLTHTAGLNSHGFDGYPQNEELPSVIEVLKGEGNWGGVAIENIPGKAWRYSGGGYVILQKLIEDVTGLSFENFMEKEVLQPLKMNHSTFQQPINKDVYKNVSSAHDNDGNVVIGGWHNYTEKGAGGLWSTPEDFIKYIIEIHNIIKGKKNGLLSKGTIDKMLTKDLNNWGLGPLIEGSGENLRFRHDGKNQGFFADFLAFANKGEGVIILTNGNTPSLKNELLKSISSVYHWNTHNQRTIEVENLPTEELGNYIGTYDWMERPGFFIEVVIQEGKLNILAPGFPTDVLTPYGKYDFIDLESEVEVSFKTSDSGKINGLTWRGRFNFEKVN